ncbi:MAG: Pycsar system effector family protein [Ferruginibacter sp.]
MSQSNLYKKTEQYVTRLFNEHQEVALPYHNLQHTKYVVSKANEVAAHYKITEEEMLVVFISSWFHDTGYLLTTADGHEDKSVEMMRKFLEEHKVDEELIEKVAGCIMATKSPRTPQTLLQQIVCDADTYNLGSKDFNESNKAVFKEMKLQSSTAMDKKEFDKETLMMLEEHEYFTSYGKDLLDARKNKNMKKVKKSAEQKELEGGPQITEKEGTTKGMQTMLRLTSTNHIQLSEMADNKANILISVNAIIISVILSVLLRKLQSDPYLTIPTIVFLLSSVITIIVAILATRPKISLGVFNDQDVINKKTNLLFFGNFHRVPQEQYEKAMRTMMRDSDYLYSSMVQDIYHLGKVLGKKYKLIRMAYNAFMIGIILSVLSFAVAAYLNQGPPPADSGVTNSSGSPF